MQFATKVPIEKSSQPIDYSSGILAMGSCFAENMAQKFNYFKFQNCVNPFGIIFNPVSMEKLISRVATHQQFTENDSFFHNGLWHCYEVHSDVSQENKADFIASLNQILAQTFREMQSATHFILTYGTSWVYRLKTTGQIVANCHKVPQNQFVKEILAIETIERSLQNTVGFIRKINPNCRIIFTVSPVRHIKDGFVENQRSKAHLIAAIHCQLNDCSYFPSYEIMMDELRDYRFYAGDLLHPSPLAIDYIWERFFQTQVKETVFPVMEEVDSIQRSLHHKAFRPNSENHQKFIQNLHQKIEKLTQQFPQIQF